MNSLARAVRGVTAAAVVTACAIVVGSGALAQSPGLPTPDFGSPPSGQVPILFNDHHVYAKPDTLRHSRVLAALIKGDTVLVPLRSLFEQTGATVTWDPSTKTVDVSKPGADVKVTVGKPEVVVNGIERPLDVAPLVWRGDVVVPLRVISEGMGAFVQWVPDRHIVVIRYVEAAPPTPLPSEVPTSKPTPKPVRTLAPVPTPTPKPTAAPATRHYEIYAAGDYLIAPKVYNELSAGNTGTRSYQVHGAIEFPFVGQTWAVGADYRHYLYPHNSNLGFAPCVGGGSCTVVGSDPIYQAAPCPAADPGCVTAVGYQNLQAFNGLGQAYVVAFTAQESDVDAHFGIKVLDPRVYVSIGYYSKSFNYLGYPTLGGVGFGIEKLPDLDKPFSIYGSAFYYPSISGKYTYPTSAFLGPLSGQQITLGYSEIKYQVGGTIAFGKSGVYLDFGYSGERANAKSNAPQGTSITAPFVGLGYHF